MIPAADAAADAAAEWKTETFSRTMSENDIIKQQFLGVIFCCEKFSCSSKIRSELFLDHHFEYLHTQKKHIG